MQQRKGKKLLLRAHGRLIIRLPITSMAGISMVSDLRLDTLKPHPVFASSVRIS